MSGSCVFCAIVEGRIPSHKVHEDERTLAFLDIHPSAPGHTLIIPKAHVARIEDLDREEGRPGRHHPGHCAFFGASRSGGDERYRGEDSGFNT
jgi:hypothetical protein